MTRCDHCEYRGSWDCDDGWNGVSNDKFCKSFKLDYFSISDKQKKEIQEMFMKEESDDNEDR